MYTNSFEKSIFTIECVWALFHGAVYASVGSDRLGELERDKARLTERLIAHQKEQISKEMDHWKKGKSKNILKKGFKKLKGKIQGRSHVFEVPEPGALGSSNTLNSGSPSGSSGMLGGASYGLDGNMSQSSQSISSSNSGRHSEDMEETEQIETWVFDVCYGQRHVYTLQDETLQIVMSCK